MMVAETSNCQTPTCGLGVCCSGRDGRASLQARKPRPLSYVLFESKNHRPQTQVAVSILLPSDCGKNDTTRIKKSQDTKTLSTRVRKATYTGLLQLA